MDYLYRENYYALAVVICTNLTIEQAFERLEGKVMKRNARYNRSITDDDLEHMIEMKKDHTWEELGEIYGLSPSSAFRRVDRYKKRKSQKP